MSTLPANASDDDVFPPSVSCRQLSVASFHNGLTHWSYKAESIADVMTRGYFDEASSLMAAGDWIFVSSKTAGAILYVTASSVMGVNVSTMCG